MTAGAIPADVLAGTADWCVAEGDAREVVKTLPSDCAHVCYCDPPYGLSAQSTDDVMRCLQAWLVGQVYTHGGRGFMGKEWDAFVPGPEVWREVYRVLKPGAYCVAFSSTRTVDLLGMAMRIAGGEMRDGWAWLHGQGFPKNLDVGKAINKVIAQHRDLEFDVTDAAKRWSGYGTATKPAYEPLVVTRKPLDGTVAENVLTHGCGTLNIDGARVSYASEADRESAFPGGAVTSHGSGSLAGPGGAQVAHRSEFSAAQSSVGRYPANIACIHDDGCERIGYTKVRTGLATFKNTNEGEVLDSYSGGLRRQPHGEYGYANSEGLELIDEWRCTETCAVAELARQSGVSESKAGIQRRSADSSRIGFGMTATGQEHNDCGSAGRFFYQGKAANSDRLAYLSCNTRCRLDGVVVGAQGARKSVQQHNKTAPPDQRRRSFPCPECGCMAEVYEHSTVKPYDLAAYHARLLSLPAHVRPIAIVPFCGTGVEARALLDVGFRVIAVDIDPRHVAMTKHRLSQAAVAPAARKKAVKATSALPEENSRVEPRTARAVDTVEQPQLSLFGGDR